MLCGYFQCPAAELYPQLFKFIAGKFGQKRNEQRFVSLFRREMCQIGQISYNIDVKFDVFKPVNNGQTIFSDVFHVTIRFTSDGLVKVDFS